MWSLAVLRCLAGGGLFGEIAWACEGLHDAARQEPSGDAEAWCAAWTKLARQVAEVATEAANAGKDVTAADAFYRASQYYQWAEAFLAPDDARTTDLYARHLDTFANFAQLSSPQIEIIDIPFEGSSLKAYFVPAEGAQARSPAVVLSDGLDGTKEEMFLVARALSRRGIACLGVDNPGQGATLRLSGLAARYDSEKAAGAAIDYLETRREIDSDRIGVWAASMGGYYAPRAAAMERRIKACVAWGAIYDYHAVWARRINYRSGEPAQFAKGAALGTTGAHLLKIMGVDSWDAAMTKLEDFRLETVAPLIQCDILIVHGEADRQTTVEEAQRLFAAIPEGRKALWVVTKAEGGAAHVQLDRPEPTLSRIADWMSDRLSAAAQGEGGASHAR
jgi:alpha-beta hydrolase superfamily lysophospholipase